MTTFAELQTLVEEQTRRPEIPKITQAAIKTATLRAHHVDFFPRDLTEGPLTYTSSSVVFQDFPMINTLLAHMRAMKIVVGVDSTTFAPVEELEYREIDDLYDSDGNRRPSIYTLVGDTLRCYFQQQTGRCNVYYFRNPDTAQGTYSSWIADMYPDDLAAWAAAIVFARSGFLEMAKNHQDVYVKPFKELLIASHLLGNVS